MLKGSGEGKILPCKLKIQDKEREKEEEKNFSFISYKEIRQLSVSLFFEGMDNILKRI